MTIINFLTELTAIAGEEASFNFVQNAKHYKIMEFNCTNSEKLWEIIGGTFTWDETPQGVSYWAEVYGKVKASKMEMI